MMSHHLAAMVFLCGASGAVNDEALQALVGRDVTIEHGSEVRSSGALIGVGAATVTLMTTSGDIVSIPKAEIGAIRLTPAAAPVPPPPDARRGDADLHPTTPPSPPVTNPPVEQTAPPRERRDPVEPKRSPSAETRAPSKGPTARRQALEAQAAGIHSDWDAWNTVWWSSFWTGAGACVVGGVAGAWYLAWGGETAFNNAVSWGGCGSLLAVPGLVGGLLAKGELEEAARLEAEARRIAVVGPSNDEDDAPPRVKVASAPDRRPDPEIEPAPTTSTPQGNRPPVDGDGTTACVVGTWNARSALDARGQYERLGDPTLGGADFRDTRYWTQATFEITGSQASISIGDHDTQVVPYTIEEQEDGVALRLDYSSYDGQPGARRLKVLSCTGGELRLFDNMGALFITWVLEREQATPLSGRSSPLKEGIAWAVAY